jgi:hypothetical protein
MRTAASSSSCGSGGGRSIRRVSAYEMERRIPHVVAPTLLVGHAGDVHAFGDLTPLGDALRAAGVAVTTVTIDAGMVPLEFTAERFAAAVAEYLDHAEAVHQ